MGTLADARFREWTERLSSHDALISIFRHVRDIPYSLAVPMSDPAAGPELMLARGRGYCGPKHYLLAMMYRRLGYDVVFATFPFLWNDPDIQYPAGLRELAVSVPVAHHLACRVRIDNRWVLVDATWDPPLKRAGFPVNEDWDGTTDTLCAVKSLRSPVRTAFCRTETNEPCRDARERNRHMIDGELDHETEKEHVRYYRTRTGLRTDDEISRIRQFYLEFDVWLETVRNTP